MFIILCLLASLLVNNVFALESEPIIGGDETKPNEIGYQVAIVAGGRSMCGGGIIDEQFIITAAHCLVNPKNEFYRMPLTIVAGTNFIDEHLNTLKTAVKAKVVKAYVPSHYNGSDEETTGDIAILKLNGKLDLGTSSFLTKLDLPPSTKSKLTSRNSYDGITATITGFGWDKVQVKIIEIGDNYGIFEDGSSSGNLLKAKSLVIPNTKCQSYYKQKIYDSQICARVIQHGADKPQGVCSGDSGGPLVYKNTVIGTVSYNGIGCDENVKPAVYTRVSAYKDFIKNVLNDVTKDIRTVTL